jgi:hypothetical protein
MILSIAAGVPKCDTLHVTRLIIAVWHRQGRSGPLQTLFRTLFPFVLRSARCKESAGKPACVSVSDLLHNRTRCLLLPVRRACPLTRLFFTRALIIKHGHLYVKRQPTAFFALDQANPFAPITSASCEVFTAVKLGCFKASRAQ